MCAVIDAFGKIAVDGVADACHPRINGLTAAGVYGVEAKRDAGGVVDCVVLGAQKLDAGRNRVRNRLYFAEDDPWVSRCQRCRQEGNGQEKGCQKANCAPAFPEHRHHTGYGSCFW